MSKRHKTTDADLIELASHDFGAVLTIEQAQKYEDEQSDVWGVVRRLAMATLTRSKADLVAGFSPDLMPDELLNTIERVGALRDVLQAQEELLSIAQARLMCVASVIVSGGDSGESVAASHNGSGCGGL